MADRVSKKRATVANTLRLLKLPLKVQHDLKVGLISTGHAKALLGVEDPALQESLCDAVVAKGLSVRELEALVREGRAPAAVESQKPSTESLPEEYNRLLSSGDEAEYMERVAVEQLGYAYPNERRFYIVNGSDQ